jgi:hypothetical protein
MATEAQSNGEELKNRTQIAQMNADSNSKKLQGIRERSRICGYLHNLRRCMTSLSLCASVAA